MFHEFTHRHTACTIDGLPEAVILSRGSSGSTQFGRESDYVGRFSPESIVDHGSMVIAEDRFLVCSMRRTPDRDKYCGMVKANAALQVQRYTQEYDSNYNPQGPAAFAPVADDVQVFAQYVSGQLRQNDPGLLPTTSYVLMMQKGVDIKRPDNPDLLGPDRVVMNNLSYQVDVIDDMRYPGLYYIQLSEDRRQ